MKDDSSQTEGPILCGTDFSSTALEAADIAAGFARRLNTKLVVVHVSAMHELGASDPAFARKVDAKEKVRLEQETARLRKDGTEVESQFRSGPAFEELVTAASDCNARFIVMGAVGHGLPHRLLVGSVAERTAETSSVPTLVVRPGGNLQSWLNGKCALRILLGYDFSGAADAAVQWIAQLRKLGSCEINLVHTYWPPEAATRFGYKGSIPFGDSPRELREPLERELQERVSKFIPLEAVTLTAQSAWGTPESCLYEISHEQKADLVVVGTHQRAGLGRVRFGSVSRAVLHHAKVSVAVIPPFKEPEAEGT